MLSFSVFSLKNIKLKALIYIYIYNRLSKAKLKIQDSINQNEVLIE